MPDGTTKDGAAAGAADAAGGAAPNGGDAAAGAEPKVESPHKLFICGQHTEAAWTICKEWFKEDGIPVPGATASSCSTPPFNVPELPKGSASFPDDFKQLNVPCYGGILDEVMTLFDDKKFKACAARMKIKIPEYKIDSFLKGKMRDVRAMLLAARELPGFRGKNEAAADKLEAFADAFENIKDDKFKAHVDWTEFMAKHVSGKWESKLSFDDVLSNFGFEDKFAKALREKATEVKDEKQGTTQTVTWQHQGLRWVSKAMTGFKPAGCLTDVVNLVFAMEGYSQADVKWVEKDVEKGLTEAQIKDVIRTFRQRQESGYKKPDSKLWVPTHMMVDCESDDMLAWCLVESIKKPKVLVQLPIESKADNIEKFLCKSSDCKVFRDPGSRNMKALEGYWSFVAQADDADWWWECCRCYKDKKTPAAKATVFCPDSPPGQQLYCDKCCALEHHWGGKKRLHTMEAIDPRQSTYLISTLLDVIVLPLAMLAIVIRVGIPDGYTVGADVCPLSHSVRKLLFSIDAGMSTIYAKPYLAGFCNLEDGYVRLFMDAFLRCALTDTDSGFLLFVTLCRAVVFNYLIIRKVIVPIAVFFHTIISMIFFLMENSLPESRRSSWDTSQLVKRPYFKWLRPPMPITKPRLRPPEQYVDNFRYRYGRLERRWDWARHTCRKRTLAFSGVLICLPVTVRVCTIVFRMGWFFQDMVPASWHAEFRELAPVSKDPYSGIMLENFLKGLVKAVGVAVFSVLRRCAPYVPNVVVKTFETVAPHTVTVVKLLCSVLLDYWMFLFAVLALLAILYSPVYYLKSLYKKQQGDYKKACETRHLDFEVTCNTKWAPAGSVKKLS